MPYRSPERAIASALEEQRELLGLERDRKLRRARVAFTLSGLFAALVAFMTLVQGARPPRVLACHQEMRVYEPSAKGREPRPPDTWTECEWR